MLIDMHTHLFPDGLAERALNRVAQINGCTYYTNGTLNDTAKKMKEWGVDHFVALNIATKPGQQHTINSWAASIQNKTLTCFGSIHPDAPDALQELERIHSLGLPGVKLHPDYQNFYVDDPKLLPIYDAISSFGLIVTFHAGKDPVSPERVHTSPSALARLTEEFPKMKIIAAHLGGMAMYEEVQELLTGKNLYLDTSMSSQLCPPEIFTRIVRAHGSERILFGSDCPWSRPCDEFDYIEKSDLSRDEKENIYWRNAAALLNQKPDK